MKRERDAGKIKSAPRAHFSSLVVTARHRDPPPSYPRGPTLSLPGPCTNLSEVFPPTCPVSAHSSRHGTSLLTALHDLKKTASFAQSQSLRRLPHRLPQVPARSCNVWFAFFRLTSSSLTEAVLSPRGFKTIGALGGRDPPSVKRPSEVSVIWLCSGAFTRCMRRCPASFGNHQRLESWMLYCG